eukprot:TRINITY_DN12459_c0_g1_i1.p1 TRINITY_DN12459_c0_g1~~TRINITY_DN12459_c0_g1_i1.p1  ORF type:complete len:269 (-),score=9.22 TRINITY_DN12459_c0_g1_i1:2-808(-)
MEDLWKSFATTLENLPKQDYVSPNFTVICADKCFPQMIPGDTKIVTNPEFRKQYDHGWYVDPNFPECGFLTRDEVHILFNAALQFKGLPSLEIGSHTGWSTVHLALAGLQLDVIEPQLNYDPRVLLALLTSLRLSKVPKSPNLVAGFSPEKVEELAKSGKKWSFIFIDGNHNGDYPLNDAKICCANAADNAMIFFHDLAFNDVTHGFLYFYDLEGWKTRVYHTQQIVGVAWRGSVSPPEHVPDPRYEWLLPQHLSKYYNSDGYPSITN